MRHQGKFGVIVNDPRKVTCEITDILLIIHAQEWVLHTFGVTLEGLLGHPLDVNPILCEQDMLQSPCLHCVSFPTTVSRKAHSTQLDL